MKNYCRCYRIRFLLLQAAAIGLLAASSVHAATIDWSGATSTDWATGSNWAGGTAPANDLTTDIANFNVATYGGNPVYAPNAGTRSINGITIGGTNGTMTLSTTSLGIGGSGISIASGAGALTISGGLTLGAAQSWINNGATLTVSAPVNNGGFLLTVDGTGGLTTISGTISGAGGLAKQSAASLTLFGTNTYSGATTVSTGRLLLNSAGALSPNTAVTVSSGAQLYFNTNSGNKTYANAMTISGVGTVEGDNTEIGAIRFIDGVTLSGTLTLPADARVGSVGTVSVTISGQVTGSGGLEFYGVKNANTDTTFTLSNTGNDYAGTTTISSKNYSATNRSGTNTLKLGAAGVIPDGVGKGLVAFTGTSASHTNILDLNGRSETINGLSTTGAAVARITNTAAGTAVLTVGAADTTSSFSGVITEAGSGAILALTKTGAGTLTLSGNNTFSGAFTVAEGGVSVATVNNASANGPLGNRAGAVLLGSSGKTGTLEYTGATASSTKPFTAVAGGTAAFSVSNAAAVLTLSGAIDGDGDKSFGGAGSTTVSGAISGGNVVKTGAGTLTLDNLNGQANTTVSGGRLNINQFAALGISTGTLTMAAGTLLDNTSTSAVRITNPKSIALGNSLTFVGTNDLDLGEGTTTLSDTTTFTVSAGTLTLGGDVVGVAFGIVKEGAGTLVLDGLSGSNSFTGNSTINSGTLVLGGLSTLGGGSSTIVTLGSNGFLNVGATASLGNVTVAGFTGNLISNTVVNANQDFTVSQTLTSANANFNGVQTIGSGVTVTTAGAYLGTVPASATAGRIVFENGATLAATAGFDIKPNQGVSLASGTAAVSVVGGQPVFIESAVAGSGGLRKIGAGNLRLTGSNSYQGGTVIDQGILGISSGAALGDVSGSLTINGAILAAATNQDGSGSGATIDAARTVLIGNGTTSGLHAQNGLTLRYDGAIAEIDSLGAAGGLQFGLTGPREGTVILGGANTYRGDTILSAGTLKLASGGSFANSPTIVVGDAGGSAAAVLDLTEKTTFAIGAGQTLKGKGTVLLGPSTALTIDGLLSPGNSPGLLTWSGSGAVTLSGTTLMEIWGTSRGTNPGYDAIDLENGTALTFGGILNLDFSQTFADGTTFNLFTPDGTSSLASTFSSITMVGSAYTDLTFTNNAGVWTTNTGAANQSMSFNSATGTLIIVVPEPGTLALAAAGLAGVAWAATRRRRRGSA